MHEAAINVIFVFLKIENKRQIVITDIICNSMCLWQSQTYIRINMIGNCLEIVYIKNNTEMPIKPTSGVFKKTSVTAFSFVFFLYLQCAHHQMGEDVRLLPLRPQGQLAHSPTNTLHLQTHRGLSSKYKFIQVHASLFFILIYLVVKTYSALDSVKG